ncbi:MAG: alpha/beta hydrolase family protein [Thermoguttaceae bacterium]
MSLLTTALLLATTLSPDASVYDPLDVPKIGDVVVVDHEFRDARRDRTIPVRIYTLLDSEESRPVIFFSHGLGGTREGSAFLGKHWAARGYFVVFIQHPGSDDGVWKSFPQRQRLEAMRQAASATNAIARIGDVTTVLDQLANWNKDYPEWLAKKFNLDLENVGMSGHSFGAQTTQAVSGQRTIMGKQLDVASRIKAAVVMSPNVPPAASPERAFAAIATPWLLMTGTHDASPITSTTPEQRRRVYDAISRGDKYELVLNEAEHSVFTESRLPGEQFKRNPQHHRTILAITTAFWDAYLKHDASAREWLQSDAVRGVIDRADIWQHK